MLCHVACMLCHVQYCRLRPRRSLQRKTVPYLDLAMRLYFVFLHIKQRRGIRPWRGRDAGVSPACETSRLEGRGRLALSSRFLFVGFGLVFFVLVKPLTSKSDSCPRLVWGWFYRRLPAGISPQEARPRREGCTALTCTILRAGIHFQECVRHSEFVSCCRQAL